MYDIERIGKTIADVNKYIKEIESYNIEDIDKLYDGKTYHASSMLMFAILNRLIDLGSEVISVENLQAPNNYQDIMPALAKANVINKETADKLNKLVRIRNVLAHFYDDISEKELFKAIKDIGTIEKFLETLKKRIERTKS